MALLTSSESALSEMERHQLLEDFNRAGLNLIYALCRFMEKERFLELHESAV